MTADIVEKVREALEWSATVLRVLVEPTACVSRFEENSKDDKIMSAQKVYTLIEQAIAALDGAQPTNTDRAEALASYKAMLEQEKRIAANKKIIQDAPFREWCKNNRAFIEAALTSAPSVPDGWQLVPKEPTNEMLNDGYDAYRDYDGWSDDNQKAIFQAMLAAAPQPPAGEEKC